MSNPRLSVLMPLYNGERFLLEALESILSQSFTNFELLIVDDGSSDRSASIVRSFCARDKRIRGFFLRKNVGIATAMNIGLREVRAPLVARMDCDDFCSSSRFARQVSYMDSHPDIYMLGCRAVNIDEAGNMVDGIESYKIQFVMGRRRIASRICLGDYPLLHATLMYRTAPLLALGGYRELFTIAEDDDLYERMFVRYGYVFANLSSVLYFYRRYSSSNTEQYKTRERRWIGELIRHSSACVRRGLSDPIDFVKHLSFPSLANPMDKFNIIDFLFYLHVYKKLLSRPSNQAKHVRELKMIRSKLSCLPKGSKLREYLDRRFLLLLLLVLPRDKNERIEHYKNLDDELFNKDIFTDNRTYSNICIVTARGCLRYGEYLYFFHYLLKAFYIDYVSTLHFFYMRLLSHIGRKNV